MSRSQNLRHNVINQMIDDMARGHIPSPPVAERAGGDVQHQPHHRAPYAEPLRRVRRADPCRQPLCHRT